ncbi:PilX N-terminal domain-containing pilus assembly protein [Halomonas sp.]|uniref:PilX N-terminal domain-containing pilus assembly protein n=1 Tax=Halomonas sp. TaxID=1486246 RepID=UPI00298DB99F|nr:PilX N-terminal domain-containing pilus assembly protein [Halomonas sp.]MDW7746182.1 PilX N-terminal domain-containing pilus assembly protein [Halomonas sp.]
MRNHCKENGAALLVTLVLLVVTLILGLSSYQASRLEESMAGNYRASSSAFMAAEFAASEAWNDEFLGVVRGDGDPAEDLVPVTNRLRNGSSDYDNLAAYYYYNEVSDGRYDVVAIGETIQDPSVYRYIQFQAQLALGPGAALVAASDGLDCPNDTIINPPTSNADFIGTEVFGSLKAAVQVGCPAAADALIEDITNKDVSKVAEESDSNPDIQTCIDSPSNKFCNYVGGVQSSIDIDIFKNPALMAEYIDSLRSSLWANALLNPGGSAAPPDAVVHTLADAHERSGVTFLTPTAWDTSKSGDVLSYADPDDPDATPVTDDGSFIWVGADGVTPLISDVSVDDSQKVIDISSDLDVGGSGGVPRVNYSKSGQFSGSGVLIVDGNVSFNGVPSFDGLIIVLGDYIVIGGGGTQGQFNGSVVSAPIDGGVALQFDADPYGNTLSCYESGICGFDKKTMEIGGGGDSQYVYNLDELQKAVSLLDDTGATADGKKASELLAYGDADNPLGYYAVDYRQSFDMPDDLAKFLDGSSPGDIANP